MRDCRQYVSCEFLLSWCSTCLNELQSLVKKNRHVLVAVGLCAQLGVSAEKQTVGRLTLKGNLAARTSVIVDIVVRYR